MHIIQRGIYQYPRYSFEEIEFDPPWQPEGLRIGVDPGTVNLGICIMAPERTALAYQVKMERDKDPMMRLGMVREVLSRVFYGFENGFHPYVVIEGASFGDKYRKEELAEQRAGIGLWLEDRYHVPVKFVPPNTVYKQVFGDGKIRAWNEWPQLPRDVASALACALFPLDEQAEKV